MAVEQKHPLVGIVVVDQDVMQGTPCFANTRVHVKTHSPPLMGDPR